MRSEIVPNAFLFISIKYNLHLENFWVEAFLYYTTFYDNERCSQGGLNYCNLVPFWSLTTQTFYDAVVYRSYFLSFPLSIFVCFATVLNHYLRHCVKS